MGFCGGRVWRVWGRKGFCEGNWGFVRKIRGERSFGGGKGSSVWEMRVVMEKLGFCEGKKGGDLWGSGESVRGMGSCGGSGGGRGNYVGEVGF